VSCWCSAHDAAVVEARVLSEHRTPTLVCCVCDTVCPVSVVTVRAVAAATETLLLGALLVQPHDAAEVWGSGCLVAVSAMQCVWRC
jgi:hypothetical protein